MAFPKQCIRSGLFMLLFGLSTCMLSSKYWGGTSVYSFAIFMYILTERKYVGEYRFFVCTGMFAKG